jgi:hypothetical protein
MVAVGAVGVGVGATAPGTNKTACAVMTNGVPPRTLGLAVAMYVGEPVPTGGAARSPNASVKPSCADLNSNVE